MVADNCARKVRILGLEAQFWTGSRVGNHRHTVELRHDGDVHRHRRVGGADVANKVNPVSVWCVVGAG